MRMHRWIAAAGLACAAPLAGAAAQGGAPAGITQRASLGAGAVELDDNSMMTALSEDGRWLAFASYATNAVPGDTNNRRDVFLRDLASGALTRVSVGPAGQESDFQSQDPALSADGRWLVFASHATNLVPGDTNHASDIFSYDRRSATLQRISVSSAGAEAELDSYEPAISLDGRWVAFTSNASKLVPGDTNDMPDVFVHDLVSGTTERVSLGAQGQQPSLPSEDASLSADGRYVSFVSEAPGLVAGDDAIDIDLFRRDRWLGTTERMSTNAAGQPANGLCVDAQLSASGELVVFQSYADNLLPGDTNQVADIYLKDLLSGALERVSLGASGLEPELDCYEPVLSADGRRVLFRSASAVLVPGDTNPDWVQDAFLRERGTGLITRVNLGPGGAQAEDSALDFALARDGRLVAFASAAHNLAPLDTNAHDDVFLRELDCSQAWCDLGAALPGAAGLLRLEAQGVPPASAATQLALSGAPPLAPGALVLGQGVLGLPLLGGSLLPNPGLLAPFACDAGGARRWTIPWSAPLPAGAELLGQAWVLDAGAASGFAASNALALVLP